MAAAKKPAGVLAAFRQAADLEPYAFNTRTHDDAQLDALEKAVLAFGWTTPVLADAEGIVAGHARAQIALRIYARGERIALPNGDLIPDGCVPVIDCTGWDEAKRRAYIISDNRVAEQAGWDADLLRFEFDAIEQLGGSEALVLTGFDPGEFDAMFAGNAPPAPANPRSPDDTPTAPTVVTSRPGDVWLLGKHRVMCGDSTDAKAVASLVADLGPAQLLHADPPYGMGKESDGVLNDNLYATKLDAFQLAWWRTWRPHLTDNAGAYIWGNAPDLWRLWYGGLALIERLTFRNEIVWDKSTGMGMSSEHHRQFATATERCLFFMLGEQDFGNVNKDDYWEGFEPIRSYLDAEAVAAGFGQKDIKALTGVGMFGHWFTKSQWTMIPEKHYATLRAAAAGAAFLKPYAELRTLYDTASVGHIAAKHEFYGTRAYFDNVHDNMTDVWNFPRVTGEERQGHATPKPVAMCARAIVSSLPPGGVVLEPFGGSGSTLIGAEMTGRTCATMELSPPYVDVIVQRWERYTGRVVTLASSGLTFREVQEARALDPEA